MLKGKDIMVLAKLMSNKNARKWTQNKLANKLCISQSTLHLSIKRLKKSMFIHDSILSNGFVVDTHACKEFFILGDSLRYFFNVKGMGMTCGIATGQSSPVMSEIFTPNSDPMYVWPYYEGPNRGIMVEPLFYSIPQSLKKYPDEPFYEILCLMDVLRLQTSSHDEREYAKKLLLERIYKSVIFEDDIEPEQLNEAIKMMQKVEKIV